MKVLIIDNYDSFTYNLVQYFQKIDGLELSVYRNDEISIDAVGAFDAIVLSPGPGLPKDAGIMPDILKRYTPVKPILGICLGEQAIAECFGGELFNLERVYHGVETSVHIVEEKEPMFSGLENSFVAGRYHSWAVSKNNFPDELVITAEDEKGVIMAIRHKEYEVAGLQFHPESIMTVQGMQMIENWVSSIKIHSLVK
jgi:anthranilate synthase component 2